MVASGPGIASATARTSWRRIWDFSRSRSPFHTTGDAALPARVPARRVQTRLYGHHGTQGKREGLAGGPAGPVGLSDGVSLDDHGPRAAGAPRPAVVQAQAERLDHCAPDPHRGPRQHLPASTDPAE